MDTERLAELRKTPRCGDGEIKIALDSVDGLIDMLEYTKPKTVLELGSDVGVSTETFLLHCEHVTIVEPWEKLEHWQQQEDPMARHRMFTERCGRYQNLTIVQGFTPDDLGGFADASFDLVYIDAVHEYQPMIDDVFASFRLVKAGGWITGHDYWPGGSNDFDIIPAVHDLFGKPDRVFSDGSWCVRRPDMLRKPPAYRRGLRHVGLTA